MIKKLFRYSFINAFYQFRITCVAIVFISAIIMLLQFTPAREFKATYDQLCNNLAGDFSDLKNEQISEFSREYNFLLDSAYGKLEKAWFERFISGDKEYSLSATDNELWKTTKRFLDSTGKYGKTIDENIKILSRLINEYSRLQQHSANKELLLRQMERNLERNYSDASYWKLLIDKVKTQSPVHFYNMESINLLFTTDVANYLFAFLLIVILSNIFTYEYELNRHILQLSMPISAVKTGSAKILCSAFIGILLSLASSILSVAITLFHTADWKAFFQPINAIIGLESSALNITVITLIILLTAYKIITFILISAIATIVSMACSKAVYALSISTLIMITFVGIGEITSQVSPSHVFAGVNIFNVYSLDTFIKIDNYTMIFNGLIHNSAILFASFLVIACALFAIVMLFNGYVSRKVIT